MAVTCQWCLSSEYNACFLDIAAKKHSTKLQCLYMSSGDCGITTAEMARRIFLVRYPPDALLVAVGVFGVLYYF